MLRNKDHFFFQISRNCIYYAIKCKTVGTCVIVVKLNTKHNFITLFALFVRPLSIFTKGSVSVSLRTVVAGRILGFPLILPMLVVCGFF